MTKKRPFNILVPRLVDADNHNAQNLNAKALLSRFNSPDIVWHIFHYNTPDPAVAGRDNVRCHQLIHGRFWTWHAMLKYQGRYDAIFYPGNECFDARALAWRERSGRTIPVVATLEGLPGDESREQDLSARVGHPVKCFRPRSGCGWTRCHDAVRKYADLNIAISPYLKRMGEHLYGHVFSVLSLGVDSTIFNSDGRSNYPELPLVVGAGTLYEAKRPEIFVQMASKFPNARFAWFGDGPQRKKLIEQAEREGLTNLSFPGPLPAHELSCRFKEASLFILPSLSEGVPKVTQEAAACGLPIVLFGFYEAPTVTDGENGFVVWDDAELFARVSELINSRELAARMGQNGARLAKAWDWDVLAPQWESAIKALIPV
jgi:glycosyltransferase involved in cell wall biosynthesis